MKGRQFGRRKEEYRKLKFEQRRETEKAKEIWIKKRCIEIETLEKEGKYDLMYKKAMELIFKDKTKSYLRSIKTADGKELF